MPDSGPAPRLKSVTVAADGRAIRVGWFAGASRDAVIDAVRSAAALPASAAFHLETEAGAVVAIDDSLPDGAALRLVIDPDPAPSAPIPVPGPKPYPILGNLPELRRGGSVLASVRAMHAQYGRFFAFEAPGTRLYFCADADMISEVQATPEVFPKLVQGRTGLADLARKSVGNALFTASDDDPMWHQAHRILLPAFGAAALKNYYGRILQVADDLFAHLDRLPPGDSFPVTELMTRMTFEAIAYAAFDKRYGGIDAVALPPFVAAMNVVLLDAMQEQRRLLPGIFYRDKRRRRAAADRVMLEEVDAIIRDRRAAMAAGGAVPTDLLQIMLTTPDRVTGLKLPDENIRGQLVTFLIAGHETTSGLLSYALYHLWKNPDILDRLIAEADAVLGRDYSYRPTYEDCARLEYTQRVLKEALRLNPPAPMFTRAIVRDTTIGGGRYRLRAGERIFFSLGVLHRDPQYWGADALAFQPDRFAPEAERARHPEAYHPFGMGARACIGFQFALIEAKMVLARFVQRYRARPADPNYVLRDKQALTVKPVGLDMLLDRRPEIKGELPVHAAAPAPQAPGAQLGAAQAGDRRMSVLYGSNMGGCRDIALSLAQQAARRGFAAGVAELDAQVGQPWLTDGPVVIVTATYNGTPPDDAARFAAWLESAAPGACKGVRFAVLGCGNRQWRQTFQKFPQSVHDRMRDLGAEALLGIGAADADGDFEAAVEAWTAALWAALAEGVSDGGGVDDTAPAVTVSVVAGADAKPRDGIGWDRDSLLSVVAANRELQAPGSGGSTRHIEIPLPASVRYAAGDHLGVYPANPPALVQAVAQRCGMATDTTVVLAPFGGDASGHDGLPFGVPIAVGDLLAEHVDLTGPVTRRELRAWADTADCPPDKARLAAWLAEYATAIGAAKPNMLMLLDQVPSVRIDLAALLTLRPTMKPRYYSISSSPLLSPAACSITVGVHRFKGTDDVAHDGLCSTYLAGLAENAPIRIVVKDTASTFRLPADIGAPVILVGPGTGLAPLRGFIQERHALRGQGAAVGPTALFFGCHGEADFLYREELEAYRRDGTLALLAVGFSRVPGTPRTYVTDLIRRHAEEVVAMLNDGGSVLVCGNARGMAPDVREAFAACLGGMAAVEALDHAGRYLQDVWALG